MKNRIFLLLIIFAAISACKEVDSNELLLIEEKGVLGNEIGKISEDGSYHKFNAESLRQFILESLEEDSFDSESVKIIKVFSENAGKHFYAINVHNVDHTINMSIGLTYDDTRGCFYVSGTCRCESTSCAQSNGCEAQAMGNECICSACSGDCRKLTEVNY